LYYKQFSESVAYSVSDGSTMPSVPNISYTAFGSATVTPMTQSVVSTWMDGSTTATVPGNVPGGAGDRWNTQVASWNINAYNIITNPSIIYYHQWSQQLAYSVSDNTVPTPPPQITYTTFGVTGPVALSTTVTTTWLDAGTQATVPTPISGGAGIQWATSGASQWTINGQSVIWISYLNNPIAYIHQYQISFSVNPLGTGVTNPSGSNVWYAATFPPTYPALNIQATPIPGYSFVNWLPTGSITFANAGNAATTATLNGPGTITANFQVVTGLSFVESGIALDGVHAWQVQLTSAPVGYVGPMLLTGTSQAIIIGSAPLGTYTYTIPSPQSWGVGTQYKFVGVLQSPVILTPVTPAATVPVAFSAQYQLTTLSNPLNAASVTLAPLAAGNWYDIGTVVTLTAVENAGATWSSWTGPVSVQAQVTTVTMTTPIAVTVNSVYPLSLIWLPIGQPASDSAGVGTQISHNVLVKGGINTITIVTNPALLPAGITVTFNPPSGFQSDANGQSVQMLITIAPNAAFGQFSWTVVACCNSLGQPASSAVYTLNIISPSVTTVGFSTTPYAITLASQSAVFFAQGHWWSFYSDGTSLLYRSSVDQTGTSWTCPIGAANNCAVSTAPAPQQGYSFAVVSTGSQVFFALVDSKTLATSKVFYWNYGSLQPGGTINWANAVDQTTNLGPNLIAAGSPNILIDTDPLACGAYTQIVVSGACIWVTVPALDTSLVWHIQIFKYDNSWHTKDVNMHTVYSGSFGGTGSSVHSQLFAMTDGIAVLSAISNTPEKPYVTVLNRGSQNIIGTYGPNGWLVKFYEQQSQAVVKGDTLTFVGLASDRTVQMFTFTYVPFVGGSFTAPTPIGVIGQVTVAGLINHSWHLSLAYAGSSMVIGYGIDGDLFFTSSNDNGVTWSTPTDLQGVSAVVNGVTATYNGSTVGMVWVERVGNLFAVRFAIV
jgi:hypothetical protein